MQIEIRCARLLSAIACYCLLLLFRTTYFEQLISTASRKKRASLLLLFRLHVHDGDEAWGRARVSPLKRIKSAFVFFFMDVLRR